MLETKNCCYFKHWKYKFVDSSIISALHTDLAQNGVDDDPASFADSSKLSTPHTDIILSQDGVNDDPSHAWIRRQFYTTSTSY